MDTQGKLVVVDGPSLNGMKGALGLEQINFPGLYRLVTEVGRCRVLAFPPIITAHHERVELRFDKLLRSAGFEVLRVDTQDGADDRALINRIQKSDPDAVGEIVVVTNDLDFIPVLRAKATQGMQIIWVGTQRYDKRTNSPCLSPEILQLCRDDAHFTFVDLWNRVEQIRKMHAGRESRCIDDERTLTIFELRLEDTCPNKHLRLASEIRRLEEMFGSRLKVRAVR